MQGISLNFVLFVAIAVATGSLWSPTASAQSGPCTKGVNCYCDRVQGGDLNDPAVVFCEDFDHPALHEINPTGPGSYGNWVSGGANRGGDSYFARVYLGPSSGSLWQSGQPGGTPANGSNCGSTYCSGQREWRKDDAWGANRYEPWLDIIGRGEFDDESGSVSPTIPGTNGDTVLGNYALGLRNPAGSGNQTGFTGGKSFRAIKKIGITAAIGYESNLLNSGVMNQPWKHDEFRAGNAGGANDALFGFWRDRALEAFPFHFFIFNVPNCAANVAAANVIEGSAYCEGNNLIWEASATGPYSFTRDFNLAQWHCMRVYYDFSNPASVTIQAFFDNLSRPVVHITGMNITGNYYEGGLVEYSWNHYANTNYPSYGPPYSSQATRRYQDNLTVREGQPVSCQQIGFNFSGTSTGGTTGGTTPLPAPVLLP